MKHQMPKILTVELNNGKSKVLSVYPHSPNYDMSNKDLARLAWYSVNQSNSNVRFDCGEETETFNFVNH